MTVSRCRFPPSELLDQTVFWSRVHHPQGTSDTPSSCCSAHSLCRKSIHFCCTPLLCIWISHSHQPRSQGWRRHYFVRGAVACSWPWLPAAPQTASYSASYHWSGCPAGRCSWISPCPGSSWQVYLWSRCGSSQAAPDPRLGPPGRDCLCPTRLSDISWPAIRQGG